MHDPRIGRFLSIDPLASKYPYYSTYAFSGNRVIDMVELEGLEPVSPMQAKNLASLVKQEGDPHWSYPLIFDYMNPGAGSIKHICILINHI